MLFLVRLFFAAYLLSGDIYFFLGAKDIAQCQYYSECFGSKRSTGSVISQGPNN